MMTTTSEKNVRRIAAEVNCNQRTVRRWWRGIYVSAIADYALTAAARKLRIRRPRVRKVVDDG